MIFFLCHARSVNYGASHAVTNRFLSQKIFLPLEIKLLAFHHRKNSVRF